MCRAPYIGFRLGVEGEGRDSKSCVVLNGLKLR